MTTISSNAASAKKSVSQPRFVRHREGEIHPVMGDAMRFIVTAEQSGGAYAFSEGEIKPGSGAPPHIHHNEDESIYVLDGSFSVVVDGKDHRLERGDFIHVPRGSVRAFTNIGQAGGRVLILHVPGAASGFYIGIGKLPFPPQIDQIAKLGERYGIEIVMPDAP